MSRARSLCLLVVAAALGTPIVARAVVVDRVVAVVNNEIVLDSELHDRERPFLPQIEAAHSDAERQQRRRQLTREMTNHMVDEILLAAQAQKMHITVGQEEIDRAMRNVARQNNLSEDQFLDALRQQGTTVQDYRLELKRELLRFQVLNARLRQKVRLSDDDVRDYYNKSVRDVRARDRFRAAWILLAVPEGAGATVVAERRTLAEGLVRRARGGELFSRLAREFSDDRATRDEGGDLGWRRRGSLPQAVDDALLDLEESEVGGPLRGPAGFYVVKVVEREASGVRPFREVHDELMRQMIDRELNRQEQIWLQDLRRRAFIRVYLDEE